MRHFVRLIGAVAALSAIGCGGSGEPGTYSDAPAEAGNTSAVSAPVTSSSSLAEPTEPGEEVSTPSGLSYETVRPGDGPQARPGDRVEVHYVATVEGGDPIDSSRERETPWSHTLGDPRAVQGFNEGVAGMKVGEIRRLVVPANLAYGALGTFGEYAPGVERNLDGAMQADELPSIPPNSTIIYEVELLGIEDSSADGPEADAGNSTSVPADPAGPNE